MKIHAAPASGEKTIPDEVDSVRFWNSTLAAYNRVNYSLFRRSYLNLLLNKMLLIIVYYILEKVYSGSKNFNRKVKLLNQEGIEDGSGKPDLSKFLVRDFSNWRAI